MPAEVPVRRLLPAIIVLVTLCRASVWSAPRDLDRWMGISLGPAKIGYLHVSFAKDKLEGYKLCEVMVSNVRAGEKSIPRNYSATIYLDANIKPLYGVFETNDDGGAVRTQARFLPDRIECKRTTHGQTVTKTVKIAPGTDLARRSAYLIGLPIGQSATFSWLEPTLLAIASEQVNVIERKEVEFEGEKRSVTVVEQGHGKTRMIDWRLDSGEVIRSEITGVGIVMTAMSRQDALASLGEGAIDLGRIQCDRPIFNPRSKRDLSLRLTGVPDSKLVISDSRQSAKFDAGNASVTYHIRAARFDPARSAKLPIRRTELDAYLEPTEGIQSGDNTIMNQAREIVWAEKSAYQAACKLRAWVHANVKQSDVATTDLSAVDVLKRRTGCCRHNAVLYAALARAAGIPTRLSAGLIYDSGAFRYHVWNESWVGEWVPLDPTYHGEFVDATHIKLVQGALEDLPALGRVAGRLRAEIISL